MTKPLKTSKTGLILPTEEEERAINSGIAEDPDTVEITELMARMQPMRRRGRPEVEHPKVSTTIRVDQDVLDAIKHSGKGWQTRVNDLLRDAVRRGKFEPV
ncbi:BrnA antitoxin family protein [Diaphorobacter sp. HDW4A]|uniref:BrnA antitoxin family protein n=1 Tax=Diaphorobacter sp. HDW4A TaxID=2714924 RepID=UPI0014083F88|nr:BrnA antitoxin family protein [Diaphorobacter sp. HDW4A]QIL83600.1 BrnA antitoxin family protein [Diaphorobacter sp. HDW4A]